MKILLTLFLALVASLASADTTNNVISTIPWAGVTNGTLPANRMPGSVLLYDTATGTVNWSYSTATASKTVAINNALSGSGVQVGGYNYTYDLRNMNGDNRQGSVDTMTVTMKMTSNTGATLLTNTNTHNTLFDWTTFSGTRSLTAPVSLSGLGNLSISFTSRDTGYWAGYFGPEVKNVGMSLNYSVDQCASNPLSSTSCAGYAAAYTTLQCNSNPLYSTACSGYQAAYTTLQCSSNPLYDTSCPGYSTAYFNQQCSANPLYATTCTGYQQAYHDQQCSINPLYATDCTGYAAALFTQTCNANPLSSTQCTGYQAAYHNQQCSANPLYMSDCAGYQQAYHNQQCSANPLYASDCYGYAAAMQTKQVADSCKANPQPGCSNYVAPPAPVAITVSTTTTAGISDPTVSAAVSTPSTTSATSPTSVISVIPNTSPAPTATNPVAAAAAAATSPAPVTAPSPAAAQETKKTEGAVAKAAAKGGVAAAAKEAAAKAANAKSLEDQAATQGLVVGLMGYVPGFSAYQNSIVPDTNALAMARQYSKANVDNRSAQRRLSGASDLKWQDMVDSQYKIGN